jgi:hypothetical protein
LNKDIQIPQDIRGFLEGLITDAGMTVDESLKEEMVRELYARLDNYMTGVIVDNLKDEDVETFIKMNEDKKAKSEIEAYLKTKLPNATELFTKSFVDFRNLYLGNVSAHRQADNLKQA